MKLPAKMHLLDDFLLTMESSLEVVPVPEVEATSEVDIRDACAHVLVIKSDVFVSIHFKRRDKSGISRRSFLRRTAVILRQD